MKKDLQNGLGFAFEHFNASWLKTHLSSLNRNVKIKVQSNKKFNDNIVKKHDRVNEETPEFENDIYVILYQILPLITIYLILISKLLKIKSLLLY